MNEPILPPPVPSNIHVSSALAITSFVLGLIAFITGLFIIGGLVGLIGLILGIIHLKRSRTCRSFAGWGIGLSTVGMALSAAVLIFFWIVIRPLILNAERQMPSFNPSEWIGKPMPEMTLTALDGRTFHTSDLKGHPVVLDMWASWHPACITAIPDFNRLVNEGSTQGIQVLAVTFENVTDLGEFTTNRILNYPLIASTNLPLPFAKVDSIPTTFFINTNGIIRDIRIGYEGFDALKQSALDQLPMTGVKQEKEDDNP